MIEAIIVIAIVAVFLGGVIAFGGSTYKHYIKAARHAEMKVDAANIRAMIQSDVSRGGKAAVHTDNHGATMSLKGKSRTYRFRDNTIFLSEGKLERKLTRHPVSDAVWFADNGLITISVVFRYNNLNSKKISYTKVIKDVDLAGPGGMKK